MNNLAGILAGEGHYSEAERLDREVVETLDPAPGSAEHPAHADLADRLAFVLAQKGSFEEAESRIARKTHELQMRLVGPEDPDTASTAYTLACIAAHTRRAAEALGLLA